MNLKTKTPTPTQVREAVKAILASSNYRQKAQRLQAEMALYEAPTLAVTLLEELAATKQPVLRDSEDV